MSVLRTWIKGAWRSRGWPDLDGDGPVPPAFNRDTLVLETYRANTPDVVGIADPSIITAGGTLHPLLPTNTPSTNLVTLTGAAGNIYTVENKLIYGDVKPSSTCAAKWIFRNCIFVGGTNIPGSISAVIDADVSRPGSTATAAPGWPSINTPPTWAQIPNIFPALGRIEVWDSLISPNTKRPLSDPPGLTLNRDGVRGHNVTLCRVEIENTTDGLAPLILPSKGSYTNFAAFGCYFHDRIYAYPDYKNGVDGVAWQTDGTHADGVQGQGGPQLILWGNEIENSNHFSISGTNPDKPWLVEQGQSNGAGVIIQVNTGTGTVNFTPANTLIIGNVLRNGLSLLNVKPNVGFTFRRNRLGWDVAYKSTSPGRFGRYFVRFDNIATNNVDGITNGNTDNRFLDGPLAGQLLRRGDQLGIWDNTTNS